MYARKGNTLNPAIFFVNICLLEYENTVMIFMSKINKHAVKLSLSRIVNFLGKTFIYSFGLLKLNARRDNDYVNII